MDPRERLDVLEGSFEKGFISKNEYGKQKEKIDQDIEEFDKKVEDINKNKPPEEEPKSSSERTLIITIAVIVMLFISLFVYSILAKEQPKTLEDLHILNLKGKLKPEQGYVYKGVYSFILFEDLWHTQLQSHKGTRIYSMALRYSPKELEGIVIEGELDGAFFNDKDEFFVTFDPTGNDFSNVALAVADFNTHMSRVFEKTPIAACDRNETIDCASRPIVTCEDSDKLVLYIKESDRFRAFYNNNCIVVQGKGKDIVKGVDRVLYNLYGIMEQEEV